MLRACTWIAIGCLIPGLVGCGGGKDRCFTRVVATEAGFALGDTCDRASLNLLPAVRIGGAWRGAGLDGACALAGQEVRCPAGQDGVVGAAVNDAGAWVVGFVAGRDVTVEGLALTGSLDLPGATTWLSNGFQSWSQSGALALATAPTEQELEQALLLRGDAEVLRAGTELSWWHTWVAGGELALVVGALDASRFKAWVRVHRTADAGLEVWLVDGGAGEALTVAAGETLAGQPWHLALVQDLSEGLAAYGRALAACLGRPRGVAEAGWNSWYELWDSVDSEAVKANADMIHQVLDPLIGEERPLRIVVDDGWQRAWGEWEPNQKFPEGLDGLAADLHAEGFEVGVWLAPLLVEEGSALVADHPDWFVEGAVFTHPMHGPMRVLDVSHPDAAAHLAQVIGRIVGWGYDLLKIDFLFAGTWEGGRYEEMTGMQAYARALEIIRGAAGEDTVLLAVGAPGIPSLPYVDAWRLGGDIAFEPLTPSWHFAVNQARSISARWPICLAVQCDPDPPILRQLTRDEVGFGAWVVSLAGGALFLSDDLRALDADRRDWLPAEAAGAALSGLPAVPVDLVPQDPPARLTTGVQDQFTGTNTHVLPRMWILPDGRRVGLNLEPEAMDLEGTSLPAHGAGLLGQGP